MERGAYRMRDRSKTSAWVRVAALLVGCGPGSTASEASRGTSDGTSEATTAGAPTSTTAIETPGATVTSAATVTGAADGMSSGDDGLPPKPTDCGTATVVDDWVQIGGPADERTTLVGARVIEGSLMISESADTDLDFLACIEEVTGDLYIHDNAALTDVDGLYWLAALGGNLVVTHNDALPDFSGLATVKDTGDGRSILFTENGALQRISGLTELVVVRGDLLLRDNPQLVDIAGLNGLGAVLGTLAINHNQSLCPSQIAGLAAGIEVPSAPADSWSNHGNAEGC